MKFPNDLVYRILERRIEIIAIAHHSRETCVLECTMIAALP
jgi:hypothetical protein